MGHPCGFVFPAVVMTLATLVGGCSSGRDKTFQGSLAVRLGASRAAESDDPTALLKTAIVTFSAIESRRTDGTWVPIDTGLPAVFELLALANGGGTVTLPPDLLPDGQYNALQARITQVETTRLDGTRVTITSPGAGWVALIPVDFGVVTGQATIVELNVRLDLSFKFVNGEVEFEPEIEVEGVEHD